MNSCVLNYQHFPFRCCNVCFDEELVQITSILEVANWPQSLHQQIFM